MTGAISHRKRRELRELETRLDKPAPFVPTSMRRKALPTGEAKLRGDILREVQAEFMRRPMRIFGEWLKVELAALGRTHE